jgi:hypothetical protein
LFISFSFACDHMRSTFTCKRNTKQIVKFYDKYKYQRNC